MKINLTLFSQLKKLASRDERQQAHEASDQTLQNDHPGAGPNYLDIPLDIRISCAAHQFLDGKFKSIKADSCAG